MRAKGLDSYKVVEGLKSLDANVIDVFVDQYSRPLFGVILNYTNDPSDAEEILQDTLLKVIKDIETFRERGDMWPWMRRIAIRNSILWLRKHRAGQEKRTQLEDLLPTFSKDGEFDQPVSGWSEGHEEPDFSSALAEELYDAVQSLPFEYRIPLVLRDIEGYSIKQISSLLGVQERSARTMIHRSRLFMREKLARYFERLSSPRIRFEAAANIRRS